LDTLWWWWNTHYDDGHGMHIFVLDSIVLGIATIIKEQLKFLSRKKMKPTKKTLMQSDDDNETCNLHNKKTKKVDRNMQEKTKTLNMQKNKKKKVISIIIWLVKT